MFTVIRSTMSVNRAYNYNEAKVRRGVAECIGTANYPSETAAMSRLQKLNRLSGRAAMNELAKRSGLHISLNFHPSERLSNYLVMKIAAFFMDRVGLGRQPWLAYRHFDAGHPHVHIVSVAIKENGKRIDMYQVRKLQKKARAETEAAFGLQSGRPSALIPAFLPRRIEKVRYGTSSTKQAVGRVLNKILNEYHYTSLAELNAVLGTYHVKADRGGKDSRIRLNGGMVYHILSGDGRKKGMPLKASVLPGKPVMALLQQKFRENSVRPENHRGAVKSAVELILLQTPASLDDFRRRLEREGIRTVLAENETTKATELIYVDHIRKSAVSQAAMGEAYGLEKINDRIRQGILKLVHASGDVGRKEESGTRAGAEEANKKQKLPLAQLREDNELSGETESKRHKRISRYL